MAYELRVIAQWWRDTPLQLGFKEVDGAPGDGTFAD
jgi:hypothetical protein